MGTGVPYVNSASPYGYKGKPIYPAASDGVIGVAATTKANTRWPFSSAGYWVDIAAPGDAIVSTSFEGGDATYDSFSAPRRLPRTWLGLWPVPGPTARVGSRRRGICSSGPTTGEGMVGTSTSATARSTC